MFPLKLDFSRPILSRPGTGSKARFTLISMVTASHRHHGERIARSCDALGIPFQVHEVPSVHRSITPKGSMDLSCTKANFIRTALDELETPLLYVDADCVVEQYPEKIDALVGETTDFAAYNWLADEDTTAFFPTTVQAHTSAGSQPITGRFYRYSHSIDYFGTSQLMCSGAVQFYNNSTAARELLAEWQSIIEKSPLSPDDHCLDYAFNNLAAERYKPKVVWLDKSYCRYPWWIFTQPVINHPDFPASGSDMVDLNELDGRRRFYAEHLAIRPGRLAALRRCLIDTQDKICLHVRPNGTYGVNPLPAPLWL